MMQKREGLERRKTLRKEAEAVLATLTPPVATAQPSEVLLHELLVHKIELEMQNEDLRKAHTIIEEARDRYVNLYEFAPVSYITLSQEALINETNLTGCALFGVDRYRLMGRRFTSYVAAQDKDHWHRLFVNIMNLVETEKHSFNLEMIRADGTTFWAHIDCLKCNIENDSPVLRLVLTDISELKRAEDELRIASVAFESLEGMMVTDMHGTILRTNRAFTDITGYSATEIIGKNPRLLKSDRQDAEFYKRMWASIHQTGGWEGEIWNKCKDGTDSAAHMSIAAIKNGKGCVTHYLARYLRSPVTER